MIEDLLIEFLKAIGKLFLNPLLYWFIFFTFVIGLVRIKKERRYFGVKIFNIFSEWKYVIKVSLIIGLALSIVTLGTGFVLNIEILVILIVVTILLSLTFQATLLSAAYSIGLTYIILLFLPLLEPLVSFDINMPNQVHFTELVILMGLLLIIEAVLIRKVDRNDLFPSLTMSKRGLSVGALTLKKVSLIPILFLIPSGALGSIGGFWPYFNIGDTEFSLIFFPFLIGFNYKITSTHMYKAADKIAMQTLFLGMIVIALAIGSMYFPFLSFIAVIIGLLGREFITLNFRMKEKHAKSYYKPLDKGIMILGIMPNSPAERLNLLVGETIVKVNGKVISSPDHFYEALQDSSASFKLDVLDDAGEVRFLSSSLYEEEQHELGLIFPNDPYY